MAEWKLADTIACMGSEDYKRRFLAEYWQTKIRYEKLKAMLTKWEAVKEKYDGCLHEEYFLKDYLGFVPTCPFSMLREQQRQMGEYLHSLEMRAALENIPLDYFILLVPEEHSIK